MIFSDLVGSTALPAKFGAAAFHAALRLHNESYERLAAAEGITIVKFTGDGYFAWCPSAAAAVRFALRFQQAMREMAWGEVTLATRLGIHLGEVSDITAAGRTDLIGSAANLASRIMSVGLGGQILLSRAPFDEGRLHVSAHPPARDGKVPALEWLAHGPYRFSGYDEPIEVFEVGAKGLAPLSPPPDGEKARRALRPGDEETLGWRPAEGLEIPGRPGWRIAEKFGAGGFGEVWAGQHVKTRERRAFKFCFDAERLRALKREVTLTRLLRETLGDREDIVRIFDLRLDAPPYFLESELSTDGNLLQWAERQGGLGKIPLDARLELVAATATALAAAHSVGVLHKDIKPTNVLIFTGKDGRARPRLVDFGIGALADSSVLAQHGITGAGFTAATLQHSSGTPTYSPPEYLAGKPFTVQGDVYSLGVMLWQLVTGKSDAPLAEGWQRDVSDPLLRDDIAACVDGDPARRLPSAAELATRLRALPERRADAVRHAAAEAADAARRERQGRLRLTTAVASLVAAIAIPLAIWAVVKQREAEREKANAQEQALLARSAEEKANAQVREASRSDTATAHARLVEGRWREAVAYLGRAVRYDPENRIAQDALWIALRHGKRDITRFPESLLEHDGRIHSASFSPDGTLIVTASEDTTARVWDAKSGKPIGEPLKHDGAVRSAGFSPDGTRIVTASEDQTARVWDAITGQPVGEPLKHGGVVHRASFSPDGARILTASGDKTARLWDAKTGQPLGDPLTHEGFVLFASFSPDGTRVVTADLHEAAHLWDAETGRQIGEPLKHAGSIKSVNFSADSSLILTASGDETTRIWDAKTGKQIGEPLVHDGGIHSASFSPDGTRIVTGSADDTAVIWDAKTGKPIGAPLKHGDSVVVASFSADGVRILTASGDKTAQVWDARTGERIGEPFRHDGSVDSASFSPDGTQVLTVAAGSTARVWNAGAGQPIAAPFQHDGSVLGASFNADGTSLVTASTDHTARIWDAKTGQPIGEPIKHDDLIYTAGFSPDGTRILTASRDKTAGLWDAKTGLRIGEPLKHDASLNGASFSPDGNRIVTAAKDRTARIWDPKSGQSVCPPLVHPFFVRTASFSPDSTQIVTTSGDELVRVWDAKSGTVTGVSFKHDPGAYSAIFSPDGRKVISAGDDKDVRIWDAKSGRLVGVPLVHERLVDGMSFSPDGTLILTSSDDVARVWDATSGQLVVEMQAHDDTVESASFSPDGTRIVTASEDTTARVLNAKTGQPVGGALGHDESIFSARFSPDGNRVVTASPDHTARVWDVSAQPLSADIAETLSAFSAGAKLDPKLGTLVFLSEDERRSLRPKLAALLDSSADWRFVAGQVFPQDPRTAPVSPRVSLTVRDANTRLIAAVKTQSQVFREVAANDPAHPVLPFAFATVECDTFGNQPANPVRAAWLCDYGIKHLPADAGTAELRLAARFVARVAATIPGQKTNVLLLLDRAAKLAPEDEASTALRDQLK